MTTYAAVVLAYPAPNEPEVYLIPENKIDLELHAVMIDQLGDFPYWCTEADDDLEDTTSDIFDLKENAILWEMAPDNAQKYIIRRWYGYVVS